jgi:uncharacterized membrane protein
MCLGTVVLVGWLGVSGRLGDLRTLSGTQWSWAVLTGLLLSAYVATWYGALARAQAVDVTAVLVFAAVITAFLQRAADGVPFDAVGIALICAGAGLAAIAGRGRTAEKPA